MERNFDLEEKIRQDAIKRCWASLLAFKNNGILKHNGNDYFIGRTIPYGDIVATTRESNSIVGDLRRCLRELQYNDPLKFKAHQASSQKCRIHFFDTIYGRNNLIIYEQERFWLKDFLNAVRHNNPRLLHYKEDYFLVDDTFYKKEDYLCVDGKAYSRAEWALTIDGELVELAKCLNIRAEYRYWTEAKSFATSFWLKTREDEKFVCEDDEQRDNWVVQIFSYENHNIRSGSHMIDTNFYSTLFRVNKKRYFIRNAINRCDGFKLTPQMLIKLEYDPTEEHKKAWKYIFEEYAKYKNKNGVNLLPLMKEDGKEVGFTIVFNKDKIKSAGIKDKIIRSLCNNNNAHERLTLDGLLNRLAVLKDIYKTEMKYESGKKQND